MANRDGDEDRQTLLPRGHGNSRYGSVDTVPASPSMLIENREEEEEEELNNSDKASVQSGSAGADKSGGCCSAVQGRDSYHRRLLIFDVLVIFLGVVTSGILFLELNMAHGQCIIGMPLYEGGLLVGSTVGVSLVH